LNGVGRSRNQRLDGRREILNPGQKSKLVEKPMVDRNVETAARLGIEEAVQALGFHKILLWRCGQMASRTS
jgi:hypothetical protein